MEEENFCRRHLPIFLVKILSQWLVSSYQYEVTEQIMARNGQHLLSCADRNHICSSSYLLTHLDSFSKIFWFKFGVESQAIRNRALQRAIRKEKICEHILFLSLNTVLHSLKVRCLLQCLKHNSHHTGFRTEVDYQQGTHLLLTPINRILHTSHSMGVQDHLPRLI